MARHRFLMCPPQYFNVSYVINPWMDGHVNGASTERAWSQWWALHDLIAARAEVVLLQPHAGVPDLVFTANAACVLEGTALLANFRHPERRREEPFNRVWFERHGFDVRALPDTLSFEGAGDALFDRRSGTLFFSHGHRSVPTAAWHLGDVFGVDVVALELSDPRFYHLDTCFCPLEGGYVMYYPEAFDLASRRLIEAHVPVDRQIVIGEQDALNFACNAVNVDRSVILNRATPELSGTLEALGFEVLQTDLSEFMKAGGSAKCLTLRLDEPRLARPAAGATLIPAPLPS